MDGKADREKQAYEQGIQRDGYDSVFSHTRAYYFDYVKETVRDLATFAEGKDVLELGSQSWYLLLWKNGITPRKLTCINISQVELDKGIERNLNANLNVDFLIMDANRLDFPDDSFDFVFGGGILHHLDLPAALAEIRRVLRPGGRILFHEPLGANPISKLTRMMTPQARTKDEKPLGIKDLQLIDRTFECRNYYEQLTSVPAGMASRLLFGKEKNLLTRMAFASDRWLDERLAFTRPFFRHVIISGRQR